MQKSRETAVYLSVLLVLVLSILTLPLLGGGTAAVAANGDWTESSISGISILDMEAANATTAWAVGYNLTQGFILKTTDGGANWVKQKSVSGVWPVQPFSSISVVDASVAWASGDRNIYRTTDGGTTWDTVYTSEALVEGIPDIGAVDEKNAWAITTDALLDSSIMRTTDGGGTWAVLYAQTYLDGILSRISAVDNFNAYVAGGALTDGTVSVSGTVLKTNTMGVVWENVTPSGAPVLMNVQALDASDVWVSGSGAIMHSTDGGATWTTPYTSSGTDFWGLTTSGDGIVWACGKTPLLPTGAKIVKTTDNGSSWSSVYSNTLLRHLFCMASVDASKAWAGGGNSFSTSAVILRTVKGGDTLPEIAAIDPAYAEVGDSVTITGSDFGSTRGTSKVLFSGTEAASYTSWSSNSITVTVPSIAGGVKEVTVVTSAGTSNRVTFLVALPVVVSSITPNTGMQFTLSAELRITGSGFLPGATVNLVSAVGTIEGYNVNVVSQNELTCSVGLFGAEAAVYDVVVTNQVGTPGTLSGGFTVTAGCGSGAGTAAVALGGMLGLLSLGRGFSVRRRRRR